jgi:predicted metal-binding membrane protein
MTASGKTVLVRRPNQVVGPTGHATAAITTALVTTLGFAAAAWIVAVRQMNGMDMGVATRLGSLGSFLALWVAMMAAMMLPGAVPAVLRGSRADGRVGAAPLFVGSYLFVWTLIGLAVFALYRPHGSTVAGVVTIMAGLYELTPLKKYFRQRCRNSTRSGFEFGFCCFGSSIGLMLMLVALGAMSVTWMTLIAVVAVAQKLLPARAAIDVPLALLIVGFGALVLIAPSSVPGLLPPM